MKIITKNGFKFITGMFWQIPDDGKKAINFSRLTKDTRHNMYCRVDHINPTWGFCHQEDLCGFKQVASLGKFIVNASKLSKDYTNSIICYQFKSTADVGEDGKPLQESLYGYIVLLNGTICPDEGEYVSEFSMVKESILGKAKRHEIETLYLPSEVARQFFSIFERLNDAYHNDELLLYWLNHLTQQEQQQIQQVVAENFPKDSAYTKLVPNQSTLQPALMELAESNFLQADDLEMIRRFIKEEEFIRVLKLNKEQDLKYLIPNIYVLSLTSDDIYWNNPKFKLNFNKSLVKSIKSHTMKKYRVLLGVLLVAGVICGYHLYLNTIKNNMQKITKVVPTITAASLIKPSALILSCLKNNDRFFSELGMWDFTHLKCNPLKVTLNFTALGTPTISEFNQLIGNSRGTSVVGKDGVYSYATRLDITKLAKNTSARGLRDNIINKLQQDSIRYGITVNLPPNYLDNLHAKFVINSKLSPLFLLNHGVLDHVILNSVEMKYDSHSGFYNWVLQGEI
jgi:hypothetical protein